MLQVTGLALPHGKKISFSLSKGERVFIQGPNGSGKSLLLKSLANLQPSDFAKFEFLGKPLRDWKQTEYRAKVLYVSPLPFMPLDGTVEDFMKAPLKLEIYRDHSWRMDLDSYLIKWNLKGMLLNYLSSGQRQMLSLLRAVNLKAEILLLDEVTSHLDPLRTKEVEELILDWQKTCGGAIVFISHDEEQSVRMNGVIKKLEDLWD